MTKTKQKKNNSQPPLEKKTQDNDYGVLSDPDEPSISLNSIPENTSTLNEINVNTIIIEDENPEICDEIEETYNTPDQTHTNNLGHDCNQIIHNPQPVDVDSSHLQESIEKLKIKMHNNGSHNNMNLHTFFSHIVIAIETQKQPSQKLENVCVHDVKTILQYIIENHSTNKNIKDYLNNLMKTTVVDNIIESIINYNYNSNDEYVSLLNDEEKNISKNSPVSKLEPVSKMEPEILLTNTQKCSMFKWFRCFFCCSEQ
jgi:DNA-binding ferritin-like protein (Dps family)